MHHASVNKNPEDFLWKQLPWVNPASHEHSQEPKRFSIKTITLSKFCILWAFTGTQKIYYEKNCIE